MASTDRRWMPRERWDALVRGDGCPMCASLADGPIVDEYGYTIADLGMSRLRLAANQAVPGYCILICKRHVREPYHLSRDEQTLFFDDLMWAARALDAAIGPVKMNLSILGNSIPHLHCHLQPRYYGDPAPGRPISMLSPEVLLTPEEYEARVALIRRALEDTRSEGQ